MLNMILYTTDKNSLLHWCDGVCWQWQYVPALGNGIIMRPSSVGGGRILRRTLSVCLSVRLSVRPSRSRK